MTELLEEKMGIVSDLDFIKEEIRAFQFSRKYSEMTAGMRYFLGEHDIKNHQRMVIGANGELEEVSNIPNHKIVDNQYKKMVVQKTNYLVGKPISFVAKNEAYQKLVTKLIGKRFLRTLRNICEDALNCGVGWLFVNYDEKGEFFAKRFDPREIIPGWADSDHTTLDYIIRLYEVVGYQGSTKVVIEKVEIYDKTGVSFFEITGDGNLIPIAPYHQPYFLAYTKNSADEEEMEAVPCNWQSVPFIPFKYNSKEISLIRSVKTLQDGINLITSSFLNALEEDARNTILVLVNYEGENLGEFRRNLATYGAVKVRSDEAGKGEVKTLNVEVDSGNYQVILEIFKKALIENGMGFDAKDDRLHANANQMNIQSMYSDIDLDANGMETEFQASLAELLEFAKYHFVNSGLGDFSEEEIQIIFNRDMLMNESGIIENCCKSVGVLSEETIVANHPWTADPKRELEQIVKEREGFSFEE
ncbi:MAG: phage portal protein [Bacillota bacterium]